jgi:hypothetical protein
MIRESMPSGHDPMGGYRFSEKIMLKQKLERDDDSKKNHRALAHRVMSLPRGNSVTFGLKRTLGRIL